MRMRYGQKSYCEVNKKKQFQTVNLDGAAYQKCSLYSQFGIKFFNCLTTSFHQEKQYSL